MISKERINVLYYGLSNNRGGIETYLFKISRNIDRKKFKLLFMDETGGCACFRKDLEELGAEFFDIIPRRTSFFKNRQELDSLFTEHQIDILHFNCNTLSYIAPIEIALKKGVKVIIHSRNSQTAFFSKIMHRLNFYRLQKWNTSNIKKIAVSEVAGEWMFGKKGRFEVYNNGVEINRFKFSSEMREQKRKELKLDKKHVYGNVGAFLEAKNHVRIIEIFREIVEIDEKAVLLLVGDGVLRNKIEHKVNELGIADKVFFLGIRGDIPQIMMAMDCLLFPSLYEGFPNVILEAETTGLPIIMSNVITPEVLVCKNCKQLDLSASSKYWADSCVNMVMATFMDEFNREHAADVVNQAGFSVEDEVKKIEKIYEDFMR